MPSPLANVPTSIAIVAVVSAVFFLTSWAVRRRSAGREEFLLANRRVGLIPTAVSIAASWLGAPSLYGAAEEAYKQGLTGLLWFLIPKFFVPSRICPTCEEASPSLPRRLYITTTHLPAARQVRLCSLYNSVSCPSGLLNRRPTSWRLRIDCMALRAQCPRRQSSFNCNTVDLRDFGRYQSFGSY